VTLQRIAWGLVLAMVLAVGWRYRNSAWVQGWVNPPDTRPAVIKFDNGTVRQMPSASEPASGLASPAKPPGGVRKCKKGSRLIYTDGPCPEGLVEAPLGNGTVNIVPLHGGGSR
jgi:hypothetical protein